MTNQPFYELSANEQYSLLNEKVNKKIIIVDDPCFMYKDRAFLVPMIRMDWNKLYEELNLRPGNIMFFYPHEYYKNLPNLDPEIYRTAIRCYFYQDTEQEI